MTWFLFMAIFICFGLVVKRLDFGKLFFLIAVLSLILAIAGMNHEGKTEAKEVNPSEVTEKEDRFERQQN